MKRVRATAILAACVALLAGCSAGQPDAKPSPEPPPSATVAASPSTAPGQAADCPSAHEVIALARREDLVGASARVETGPICADDWQFTTIVQPGTDPLQVVTRLRNGTLQLVAAGTELCGQIDDAPKAIRDAASYHVCPAG